MEGGRGLVEVIAHRGASQDAPEHTIAAYDLALQQGADALELDLRLTADGELVVLHDRTLARTAGEERPIDAIHSGELSLLPAAGRPLTLGEVLERYGGRTGFLLELKDPTPPMERRLVEILAHAGVAGDVTVQSFCLDGLRRVRRLDRRLALAPLFAAAAAPPWRGRWLDTVVGLGASAIGLHRLHVDATVVAAARSRGLRVRSWTVNDPAEAARHVGWGVDGVITDVPRRVAAGLDAQVAA